MKTTEQAQQLRLAAEILETGHPWEYQERGNWFSSSQYPLTTPAHCVAHQQKIHLALATPPDGRLLHNPDNLTAEQVGAGFRLGLKTESANQPHELWDQGKWSESSQGQNAFGCYSKTYRVPLAVPWPEATKPEPTTKTVPLGPEDVPPGSWVSVDREHLAAVITVSKYGMSTMDTSRDWKRLMNEGLQINRSIPLTGKWDANAWEPCSKEVPA